MSPLVKALMCLKCFDFGAVKRRQTSSERNYKMRQRSRHILVAAARNNRFKAQVTRKLKVCQEGQPKIIRDISREIS